MNLPAMNLIRKAVITDGFQDEQTQALCDHGWKDIPSELFAYSELHHVGEDKDWAYYVRIIG